MKPFFKRNTCRLCHDNDLEHVLAFPATPVGDEYVGAERVDDIQNIYPLDLYFCNSCGLLQLLDVVAPEIIYGEYMYQTSISLGLPEHFQKNADEMLHRINPPPGALVVDIGSNDGTFLRAIQNRGMRVLGIEPAREMAQKVTDSGIETLATFFSSELARQIKKDYGESAIITANNVMANIDDLADFAEGIRELLAPDGVFLFETGYVVDLIQNSVIDNIYHEHLCYFRVKPLVNLFNNHGLEVIEVEHISTKGGSLRGTIQMANGPRTVSSSVSEQIALETRLGYDNAEIYQGFASRMDMVKKELLARLHDLKTQGKTIAGYGASVGVTTLLYYYELGDILTYLFDDNPSKHHLFSPGHHIPVLPSHEIHDKKPDYIVVLAWRYATPIMQKHQQYQEQDGHFILPLPEVKVI